MNMNSFVALNNDRVTPNRWINPQDAIDDYLDDPNLSVSEMMDKYEISLAPIDTKKEKKNLRCVVCGARAFGYNFDRITCESCKAFFRRNALRNMDDLHCRFVSNCNVTVESRRHCSYCRIQKCFTVGMRKEWIRSEDEKREKRLQVDVSRRRKRVEHVVQIPNFMPEQRANISVFTNGVDRQRLNNLTHCYDQYTGEPCILNYTAPPQLVTLRLDEFYNRKKPIVIHFVSYFKHLPELQRLDMDDQVALIKHNLRLVLPLNYALLKTPACSQFSYTHVQTTGCVDNINLHEMYRSLSNSFVQFVTFDPLLVKLFILVLFFSTDALTTVSIYDSGQYKQREAIKAMQTSYMELLWLYMIEKCGEKQAILLFTKLITKYLYAQIIMDQIDSIIRMNSDVEHMDSLLKTVLHLT